MSAHRKADVTAAIEFLRQWPSDFPHLVAIHVHPAGHTDRDGVLDEYEKGLIEAHAFSPSDLDNGAVEAWLREREGRANLYFTVNSLIVPMDKKAAKVDVREMVALHLDVDLPEGIPQDTGIEALLAKVPGFKHQPSLVISSGGGIQCFWVLAEAARVPGGPALIETAEAYNKAMEVEAHELFGEIGKVDRCFNIDRIMRLPGSINVPDKGKRAKGRKAALARIVAHNDKVYDLSAFGAPAQAVTISPGKAAAADTNIAWDEARKIYAAKKVTIEALRDRKVDEATLTALLHGDNLMRLHEAHKKIGVRISQGPYESFSDVTLAIAGGLARGGLSNEEIAAVLGDQQQPGNRHVTRQKDERSRQRAMGRAINKARSDIDGGNRRAAATAAGVPMWRDCSDPHGLIPKPTLRNAVNAIEALGVTARLDLFRNRVALEYKGEAVDLQETVGELTDRCEAAIRGIVDEKWQIDLGKENVHDGVLEIARKHASDPILDYLVECEGKWDTVKRIDTEVLKLLGIEVTPLNSAIVRTMLVGSVRRARVPGAPFQLIAVLEGAEGLGKSKALKLLYGEAHFSDQHILGLDDQQVMEQVEGIWGYECAELTGMKRADVDGVKAFLSRPEDKARRAYGRVREDVKRRCVFWGSTNDDLYLQGQTGNRRWGPLSVVRSIDLVGLAKARDQIWGEAAHDERSWSKDEEVNIPEALWPAARIEQEKRRRVDGWEIALENIPALAEPNRDGFRKPIIHERNGEQIVLANDLLTLVLGEKIGGDHQRLKRAMERNEWTSHRNPIRITGDRGRGYTRPIPNGDDEVESPPTVPAQSEQDAFTDENGKPVM